MRKLVLLLAVLFAVSACGPAPYVRNVLFDKEGPYGGMYLKGIKGAENLDFDGNGAMYVTTLDGNLYRVVPGENPNKGEIAASRKLGKRCFGVCAAPDNTVYAGVELTSVDRRIFRLDSALEKEPEALSGAIQGLNGMEIRDGYLYYTTSDEGLTRAASGKILRVSLASPDFKNPETVVDNAGCANGIAFSPNGKILYYTATYDGVWLYNLVNKEHRQIATAELLGIADDLDVAKDGTVWFCSNSQKGVVPVKREKVQAGYRLMGMGAPSSCKFGKGPGFDPNTLYITELSRRARCLRFNGRGVWALPLNLMTK
jgi:hypothetical protein